jgi:hypothetical protein
MYTPFNRMWVLEYCIYQVGLAESVMVGIVELPVSIDATFVHKIVQDMGVKKRDVQFLGE